MRITGGEHRGRVLRSPENAAIRPTSDKVRQAIFNMLNARGAVVDAVALDAFCGTGALGLESLSQGASSCVFMDQNRFSLDLCKENAEMLKVQPMSKFILKDATRPGPKPGDVQAASLVFLDPPYKQNLIPLAIEGLGGWIAAGAMYVLECEKNEPVSLPGFTVLQEKIYGDTKVILAQA